MNKAATVNKENTATEMPYERFLKYGPESLTDTELIAIIVRTGTKDFSAVDVSRRILTGNRPDEAPSLSVLYDETLEDLTVIPGIGEVKAVKILCIAELSKRLSKVKVGRDLCFASPRSIFEYYGEEMRHLRQEKLLMLLLDNRMSLIREETVSIGTINTTLVSVREIFVRACRFNAVNFILIHNHPSGDSTPSHQDVQITRKILEASRLMEIGFVDHMIISDDYRSMKQMGYFG